MSLSVDYAPNQVCTGCDESGGKYCRSSQTSLHEVILSLEVFSATPDLMVLDVSEGDCLLTWQFLCVVQSLRGQGVDPR